MAELIIRSGKHQGKKLVLPAARVLIGRDASCQIRLASSDVSRQHCSLRITPEGIYACDLGSRNGTLVNDVPITEETILKAGDMLRIGPILLQVPKKKEPEPVTVSETVRNQSVLPATDDDIVSWLSDDDDTDGGGMSQSAAGETTIISKKDDAKPAVAPKAPAPPRRQFKSIADEAADIIRRFREKMNQAEGAAPPRKTS